MIIGTACRTHCPVFKLAWSCLRLPPPPPVYMSRQLSCRPNVKEAAVYERGARTFEWSVEGVLYIQSRYCHSRNYVSKFNTKYFEAANHPWFPVFILISSTYKKLKSDISDSVEQCPDSSCLGLTVLSQASDRLMSLANQRPCTNTPP